MRPDVAVRIIHAVRNGHPVAWRDPNGARWSVDPEGIMWAVGDNGGVRIGHVSDASADVGSQAFTVRTVGGPAVSYIIEGDEQDA